MPSFTPDSSLDLLFDPSLIPDEVRKVLAEGLHLRPLASTDDTRGLFPVLTTLSPSPTPASDDFAAHFQYMKRHSGIYFVIVIIDTSNDQVVGTGTVFIEHKLIRNLGLVGHIEDIVVSPKMQGKKLGLRIINTLTHISEHQGGYKTILNCSNENIPFYQKCGFKQKENEMVRLRSSIYASRIY
ncbi:glucosamine 6-phosphate N-acetyltransferase [Rhizoctonia solani AG-3 Rhs1AP]|uniref:Glucosamine 6-phosphate N-acetyltransferase n=2 Tax=Rhizoctonia solani AG-3 TaxID=1086053 RepID=A0A074S4U3_9AGAM|nr:glucosamine 6-phosphate N-acetyltransferase [Rhizoctonia solani AG-3 Rhs1AP]KEP52605.1 glucosamine 6-phosphate N-acetyltransferase [Rhizoctonia solani 123E]